MKRLAAKRNASLISVCFVCVIVVLAIGIVGKSLQTTIEGSLNQTKKGIEEEGKALEQYQELQDIALFINDRWQATTKIDQDRVYWSQVITDLLNCVPIDVQFENLVINSDKAPNFVLQGNAKTERDIIKFKEKLENSIFFQNVAFKSSTLSKEQQEQSDKLNFTLEFDLEQKKAD